ncbi:MAG: FecR domain-containing protein [Opitutales bacterium]
MNPGSSDIEFLIQKFADDSLSEAEDRALAEAIERDAEVRDRLRALMQFEDAMSQSLNAHRAEEMFIKALKGRLSEVEGPEIQRDQGNISEFSESIKRAGGSSEIQRNTKIRRMLLGVSLAAAACLVIGLLSMSQNTAPYESARAMDVLNLTVQNSSGGRTADGNLETGEVVKPGATVKTSAGSQITFRYPDQSRVTLLSGSALIIAEPRDASDLSKRLYLQKGQLRMKAFRQKTGFPVEIETDFARIEVLGTEFSVAVSESYTELRVYSGLVRFYRGESGADFLVEGGQRARLGPNIQELETPLLDEESANFGKVLGFSLVHQESRESILGFDPFLSGTVLSLSSLPSREIDLKINTMGVVDRLRLLLEREDPNTGEIESKRIFENESPFYLQGRRSVRGWISRPGRYKIDVKVIAEDGVTGEEITLKFEVIP